MLYFTPRISPLLFQPKHWVWSELLAILKLAIPTTLSSLGILAIITTDIVMLGRYAHSALAAYGLALALGQLMSVVCFGLLGSARVLTAHHVGAGYPAHCGLILRANIRQAILLGGLLWLLSRNSGWFFRMLQQSETLIDSSALALQGWGWGMPAFAVYLAVASVLEGLGRPKPAMIVTGLAVVLNAFLNWVFIFSSIYPLSSPEYGATLATSIARSMMMVILLGWALFVFAERKRYGLICSRVFARSMNRAEHIEYTQLRKALRRFALPMCIAFSMEACAFSAVNFLVGWIGEMELAAYQIVQNVYVLVYMLTIGCGAAISVRVGFAYGKSNRSGCFRSSSAGLLLLLLYILPTSVFVWWCAPLISAWYATDLIIIGLSAKILQLSVWFLFFDALQGILVGALRGMSDFWRSGWVVIGGFWIPGVLGTYWLSIIHENGLGGVVSAMTAGTLLISLLLSMRLIYLMYRLPPRL